MKKRKNTAPTLILIFSFIAGLSLLLYPTVSNYWNSLHQTKAIAQYSELVSGLAEEAYNKLLSDAHSYNETLLDKPTLFPLTDQEREEYQSLLSVPSTNVIGYIEIAKIDCYLPIYHGTEESVLQIGVGHLEGSSLPVGGESTHCVLSGHRGLPSAKLFTDLDKLEAGDIFTIYVLNETLTYEVDQIRIVEPYELDELAIVEGEDLCTLLTCTPYGINTHRLLVRGHRIDTPDDSSLMVTADAMQIDPMTVAPLIAAPILAVLIIVVLLRTRRKTGK